MRVFLSPKQAASLAAENATLPLSFLLGKGRLRFASLAQQHRVVACALQQSVPCLSIRRGDAPRKRVPGVWVDGVASCSSWYMAVGSTAVEFPLALRSSDRIALRCRRLGSLLFVNVLRLSVRSFVFGCGARVRGA
jgi:hypothetical protein